jgi:sporulation protein YlmC with PRC-barrel domain
MRKPVARVPVHCRFAEPAHPPRIALKPLWNAGQGRFLEIGIINALWRINQRLKRTGGAQAHDPRGKINNSDKAIMKTRKNILTAGAVTLFSLTLAFGPPALHGQVNDDYRDQQTESRQTESMQTQGQEQTGAETSGSLPGERVGQEMGRPETAPGHTGEMPGERVGQEMGRPETAPGHADQSGSELDQPDDQQLEFGVRDRDEFSQQHSEAQTSTAATHKTSDLEGLRVVNSEGERIGTIDSLAVDLQNQEVAYIVVSSGGLFGIGSDLRVIPVQLVEISSENGTTGDRKVARIDISEDVWNQAPTIERDEIARLCDEARAREIFQAYGLEWEQRPILQFGDRSVRVDPAAALDAIETEVRTEQECRLVLTNKIKGNSILGAQQEDLGNIDNLVVDLNSGRVVYLLVSPETRFWRRSQEVYAIAPTAITSLEDDRVVLSVTQEQLQQAEQLSSASLSQEAQVYRMDRNDTTLFGARDTAEQHDAQATQQEAEQQQQQEYGARVQEEELEADDEEIRPLPQTRDDQQIQEEPALDRSDEAALEREFGAPGRALGHDQETPRAGQQDREVPSAHDADQRSAPGLQGTVPPRGDGTPEEPGLRTGQQDSQESIPAQPARPHESSEAPEADSNTSQRPNQDEQEQRR